MPVHPYLPDDVAEVASITISVGMGKDGDAPSYEYEGLSPEAALGYVMSIADQLREEIKWRWAVCQDDLEEEGNE